jgi:hypothetical protein
MAKPTNPTTRYGNTIRYTMPSFTDSAFMVPSLLSSDARHMAHCARDATENRSTKMPIINFFIPNINVRSKVIS